MNILIIGGSGYLGRALSQRLLECNNEIFWINQSGKNFSKLKIAQCLTVNEFLNSDFLEKVKIDWIINCTCKYEANSYGDIMDANFYIPQMIFHQCYTKGIKKYLSVSTALPGDFNYYSKSKELLAKLSKWHIQNYYQTYSFYNVLLQNFYGENEPATRFIPYVVSCMKKNEPVNMTEGNQIRDYIYIEDVIENLLHLLEHPAQIGYYDIPLGTGEGVKLKNLVFYIKNILNSSSIINLGTVPMRKNEPILIADKKEMDRWGLACNYDWQSGFKYILEKKKDYKGENI